MRMVNRSVMLVNTSEMRASTEETMASMLARQGNI